MENAEEWISLREFARRREVSLAAVQKAIESGRVRAVTRDGNGRLTSIEFCAAMREWNGNTDPAQAARSGKILGGDGLSPSPIAELGRNQVEETATSSGIGADAARQIHANTSAGRLPFDPDPVAKAAAPAPRIDASTSTTEAKTGRDNEAQESVGADKDPHGYYEARADRERAQAKRAELDYLERVGSLVSLSEVREEEFAIFRKFRDNIMAIGTRLAPRLAAETDPLRIQHLFDEEIRRALNELSRALGVDAAGRAGERPDTLQ